MGQSYRVRTQVGINKTININLEQDFEFLEILSLKLQQSEVYDRNCANYGVVVGRVTANEGFGIPNAKVSIFIPIQQSDESNPIISSIYPYKSPSDKNEDGYRYNLLPYEKSYSTHSPTGTFPSKLDAITNNTAIEIYDNYYKLTSKTNDSGDYMIMGAPLGAQTIVMDVDLSDIGEFSLSPQDLIRVGVATEAQVGGNTFKSSSDLNSLPQIVNLVKTIEISPLWGNEDICQVAINRLDFDLRDDANIDIRPTSVFMGSMFSSPDKMRLRPGFNLFGIEILGSARPKDNLGNLCELIAGPGQILSLRQTIFQDENGNPILEEYKLEQSGNVIDGDGTWLVELPMNLDYYITNEFGEKVISDDPSVGIPTKGRYRFKIKWQQPPDLTRQARRAYYIVPNVKEHGWTRADCDPNVIYTPNDPTGCYNYFNNQAGKTAKERLSSSYYFGLDWSGYTKGFEKTQQEKNDRLNELINCEDGFYEFNFNKVYTVSSLIDQWKRGGRGRFIGIKEVDDDSCSTTVNKFPVNEAFQNFDLLYFLFSLLLTIISFVVLPLLVIGHIILFLYSIVIDALCWLCNSVKIFGVRPFQGLCPRLRINCVANRFTIRLPMITYPDCATCECKTGDITTENVGGGTTGVLSYVSSPGSYISLITDYVENNSKPLGTGEFPLNNNTETEFALILSQALSGNDNTNLGKGIFKTTKSDKTKVRAWNGDDDDEDPAFASSDDLPLGERINIFNGRHSYFSGLNRIKVSFDSEKNPGVYHYDNTIMVLTNQSYNVGDMMTTVNPSTSSDINFLFTAETTNGLVQGIEGVNISGANIVPVNYANPNNTYNEITVSYNLTTGTTINRQVYPSDREYFQVLTAITVSDSINIWKTLNPNPDPSKPPLQNTPVNSFLSLLASPSRVKLYMKAAWITFTGWDQKATFELSPLDYFEGMEEQYILILQRGVDPYSPKFKNKYGIGKLLGLNNEDDIIIEGNTRLNIPIQKIVNNNLSVQNFNKNEMYYKSYFFTPGDSYSAFTSDSASYYGRMDRNNVTDSDSQIYDKLTNGVPNTIISVTSNNFHASNITFGNDTTVSSKYDDSEDLSGGSNMYIKQSESFDGTDVFYSSPVIYYFSQNKLTYPYGTKEFNILRTDRLPSSDVINGQSWKKAALLQQNNNFQVYLLSEGEDNPVIPTYTTGADQVTQDIAGQPGATRVLSSFDCADMVSLKCYEGFGDDFNIDQACVDKDNVERGCYLLMRRPLRDLRKDFNTYSEWSLRFRFFYGLCRGVLSQSFTNNWINGTLFAFPIQVNTYYNKNNKPYSVFARELIYFDEDTTNFYYRSSPYDDDDKKFIGKEPEPSGLFQTVTSVNDRNLLFPTTIMDLGMKEKFYSEIILEPYTRGYVMSELESTTYGDQSDIVNLFVISRITDAKFLDGLIAVGDNSFTELFTRHKNKRSNRRVDGDFAQLISINSEIGLINFSPEYYEVPPCDDQWCKTVCCKYQIKNENKDDAMTVTYEDCDGNIVSKAINIGASEIINCNNDNFISYTIKNPPVATTKYVKKNFGCVVNNSPTRVLGTQADPAIAVWFSSTTENLQIKDFISPGTINFRTNDLQNNFPFQYGIKSQKVPFYQWEIKPSNNIFGTQLNDWYTKEKFYTSNYQSLDRRNIPPTSYFQSNTIPQTNDKDLYQRGYIFSVDAFGVYSTVGKPLNTNKFIVGAPYQFYFGVIKGESALDKYKRKYLADE
jgi:hypothetical protein